MKYFRAYELYVSKINEEDLFTVFSFDEDELGNVIEVIFEL